MNGPFVPGKFATRGVTCTNPSWKERPCVERTLKSPITRWAVVSRNAISKSSSCNPVPTGGLNGNISHAHKLRSNITHFKLSAPAWEGRLTLGFLTISVYFCCVTTLWREEKLVLVQRKFQLHPLLLMSYIGKGKNFRPCSQVRSNHS